MNAVSPHQIRFSPESLPVVYVAHIIRWAPPRQPAVERRHSAIQFVCLQIWERARENYGVRQRLGISTHRFHINFSEFRAAGSGVITTGVYYNLTVSPLILSQQLQTRLHVARSGPREAHDSGPWLRYFHVPDYRAPDNQGVFLSGCVAEQGKLVRNVKWLVHSGLLCRLTTPANSYPTIRLHGYRRGTANS